MADERNDTADADEEEGEIPVMQKVAILFIALGQETCGEVMKFLSDYEIEEPQTGAQCPASFHISGDLRWSCVDRHAVHL